MGHVNIDCVSPHIINSVRLIPVDALIVKTCRESVFDGISTASFHVENIFADVKKPPQRAACVGGLLRVMTPIPQSDATNHSPYIG